MIETLPKETLRTLVALYPLSIVLTGSSASGEVGKTSDVDVMVIFSDKNYVERKRLRKLSPHRVRLYPFRLREIQDLSAPHPFPQKFYFWWLSQNAKTIWGKRMVENLDLILTKNDLREVLAFERGVALSALHAFRNSDRETARISFSKSCLFGTTAGVGLRTGKTPSSYKEATIKGMKVFTAYARLIEKAERMRKSGGYPTEQDIYDNLKYLHDLAWKPPSQKRTPPLPPSQLPISVNR